MRPGIYSTRYLLEADANQIFLKHYMLFWGQINMFCLGTSAQSETPSLKKKQRTATSEAYRANACGDRWQLSVAAALRFRAGNNAAPALGTAVVHVVNKADSSTAARTVFSATDNQLNSALSYTAGKSNNSLQGSFASNEIPVPHNQ